MMVAQASLQATTTKPPGEQTCSCNRPQIPR